MTEQTEKWLLRYLLRHTAQLWRWYPVRKEKKYPKGATHLVCEQCGLRRRLTDKARKQFEVDHREPVGQRPYSLKDFIWYLNRRFCGPENLQLLCKKCHSKKTKAENERRYAARRLLKGKKDE